MIDERFDVFELEEDFVRIIYACPGIHDQKSVPFVTELRHTFPGVELYKNLPSFKSLGLDASKGHSLLVFDDLSVEFLQSKGRSLLFTRHLLVYRL